MPLALGAAVSPVLLFGAIAVMTGPQPLRRGAAYAFGAALPLLAVTALAFALGNALELPAASESTKGWIDVAFGVVLLALGLRALSRPAAPTESRPRREGRSLGRYIAMGSGLMASNVTTLALYIPAMNLINESAVSDESKAVVVVVAIAITLSLALVPLALVALAPNASGRLLAATGEWLGSHRRRLAIVICFGLGAYLVIHGLARL